MGIGSGGFLEEILIFVEEFLQETSNEHSNVLYIILWLDKSRKSNRKQSLKTKLIHFLKYLNSEITDYGEITCFGSFGS